jgi:hypothetical protein
VLAVLAPLLAASAVAIAATVSAPSNITKQSGYNGEGTIAVNPTDPTRLFAGYNNHSNLNQWRRSSDGGATWTTAGSGIGQSCCDNQAEWDRFGNLYLTNINAALNAVPLFLSTDNGSSFNLLSTIGTGSVDQPTLKAGPDSIWVAWDVDNGVVARGAPVTGLGAGHIGAFSTAQLAPNSDNCQFGDIAVSPAGAVVDVCQNDTTIFSYTDADGLGPNGFAPAVVASSTNVDRFDSISPQQNRTVDAEANLAYDLSSGPHAGRLYLVYTDETPDESNNTDIELRHSDNNGATWSAPVKVNDDATTRAQFFPVVTVDPTSGNVFVSFLDCRNDPGNTHTQYWGAISTDGGVTFEPNVQLSAGSSSANQQSDHGNEYGDYSGNDFYGGNAYAIWPDDSNSTGDNPNGTADFDMYAGKVTESGGGGGGTPPTIKSFSPSKATNGQTVKFRGSGFTGTTAVTFNGKDAYSFTIDSDTKLEAVVPVAAPSGPISVTTGGGTTQTTKLFTFKLPKAPKVTKLTPKSGPVGTSVVIKGSGLFGASAVTFNGTNAQSFTVNSDKQITAVVAAGTTTGAVVVTAPGGMSKPSKIFTVGT